ncbi:MAG: Rieske 2Fe-2S domain-containing protein [Chitinophagaceae bacterium]|nr:Rieske 2Fe-2S domain-containing protein [Chitinophagaceae bacterium]
MAAAKTYNWHKVAETAEELPWQDNHLCEIEVNGKTICMARHGAEVFACTHKCPHAGGHLADGFVDALGNLVCPLHRYKFHPQSGRNVSGEGYFLKTYPVEQRADGIYVGLEEGGWFGLFK